MCRLSLKLGSYSFQYIERHDARVYFTVDIVFHRLGEILDLK